MATPSTTGQRNLVLDTAALCDVVVFLDDDFLAEPGYLAATARAMAADPAILVSTGVVLADGAKGPGLSLAQGRAVLAAARPAVSAAPVTAFNGYGCNMAIRLGTVRSLGLRFDERLVFYAWYEDIDFTRRLGAHGRIVRLAEARGVHLGVKIGRGPGRRLGYSQVINPIYLARKGCYPWRRALTSIARHLAINAMRAPRPESYIDRRGRLVGNLRGVWDLARGHVAPERAALL